MYSCKFVQLSCGRACRGCRTGDQDTAHKGSRRARRHDRTTAPPCSANTTITQSTEAILTDDTGVRAPAELPDACLCRFGYDAFEGQCLRMNVRYECTALVQAHPGLSSVGIITWTCEAWAGDAPRPTWAAAGDGPSGSHLSSNKFVLLASCFDLSCGAEGAVCNL